MKDVSIYASHYTTLILGLTLSQIEAILSIVCFVVSIALGVLTIIIKLKAYLQDGKISKDELDDLLKEINDIKDKVDKNGNRD